MNRRIVATAVAGLVIGMTALGASAQADRPAAKSDRGMQNMQGMQGKPGKEGEKDSMEMCERMMGGGMMGGGMMGHGMMGGGMMPQLPAGNEKLQVQMQAEIMQKVGEIVAKYAAQAK